MVHGGKMAGPETDGPVGVGARLAPATSFPMLRSCESNVFVQFMCLFTANYAQNLSREFLTSACLI